MLEKLKLVITHFLSHHRVRQLQDVRVAGLIMFGLIMVLVTWSGIKTLQTNYELQKKISKLEQQTEVERLETENLKLSNEYYNTDAFLELAARRQLGKAAPGEKVIVVPKEVALKHAASAEATGQSKKAADTVKPKYQQNFDAWFEFVFHHPR